MTTSTKSVSRALLNQETDARFWAQTHYKIGRPLNMKDPTDRAMAKVWHDINLAVAKEDRTGKLRVTFNDPAIKALLADAATATEATRAHLEAAAQTPDPAVADVHIQAAAQSDAVASSAARGAAAKQPPTVSPIVVQAAAAESARALGQPPPPPIVYDLPPDHPAVTSPAARPELPVRAIVEPMPEHAPSPHPHPDATTPTPPPRDVLSEAKARAAPGVAVAVHDDHARDRQGSAGRQGRTPVAIPMGTTQPKALAGMRGGAQDAARKSPGDLVGVTLSPAGEWIVSTFSSPGEMAAWYGDFTNHPSAYRYAAYYDKTDGATWPAPVEETLGTKEEIPVRVQIAQPGSPPRPGDPAEPEAKNSGLMVPILVAGAAVAGLALLASSSSTYSSHSSRSRRGGS